MKTLKTILIVSVIGVAGYFGYQWYQKKKKGGSVTPSDAANTLAATNPAASVTSSLAVTQASLEKDVFNKMSKTLEADAGWKTHGFPGNFYEYVKTDYEQNKAGKPRTETYKYGLPGSFMSVADAWWPDDKIVTKATHEELWRQYSDYIGQVQKASLMA